MTAIVLALLVSSQAAAKPPQAPPPRPPQAPPVESALMMVSVARPPQAPEVEEAACCEVCKTAPCKCNKPAKKNGCGCTAGCDCADCFCGDAGRCVPGCGCDSAKAKKKTEQLPPPKKDVKACPCSGECVCGCNEGRTCVCGNARPASSQTSHFYSYRVAPKPTYYQTPSCQYAAPAYYQTPSYQAPAYQYQAPAYQYQSFGGSRGRRSSGC